MNYLSNLVKNSFKKGYVQLKKFMKEVVTLNASTLAHSYCKFIKIMAKKIPEESLNSEVWKKAIEKMCVFCYVWTIGAIVT